MLPAGWDDNFGRSHRIGNSFQLLRGRKVQYENGSFTADHKILTKYTHKRFTSILRHDQLVKIKNLEVNTPPKYQGLFCKSLYLTDGRTVAAVIKLQMSDSLIAILRTLSGKKIVSHNLFSCDFAISAGKADLVTLMKFFPALFFP